MTIKQLQIDKNGTCAVALTFGARLNIIPEDISGLTGYALMRITGRETILSPYPGRIEIFAEVEIGEIFYVRVCVPENVFSVHKANTADDCSEEYLSRLTHGAENCFADFLRQNQSLKINSGESDVVLYNYLQFLELRSHADTDAVGKPLIVSDFLERIDEAVDVSEIIHRTAELPHQTFLFIPYQKDLTRIPDGIWC